MEEGYRENVVQDKSGIRQNALCWCHRRQRRRTMAPIIPSSLSPHIAILTSPDLVDLLENAKLPSLAHVLQSFSPLPQGQ